VLSVILQIGSNLNVDECPTTRMPDAAAPSCAWQPWLANYVGLPFWEALVFLIDSSGPQPVFLSSIPLTNLRNPGEADTGCTATLKPIKFPIGFRQLDQGILGATWFLCSPPARLIWTKENIIDHYGIPLYSPRGCSEIAVKKSPHNHGTSSCRY
jgi:hypothetical protein